MKVKGVKQNPKKKAGGMEMQKKKRKSRSKKF